MAGLVDKLTASKGTESAGRFRCSFKRVRTLYLHIKLTPQ